MCSFFTGRQVTAWRSKLTQFKSITGRLEFAKFYYPLVNLNTSFQIKDNFLPKTLFFLHRNDHSQAFNSAFKHQ